MEEKRYKVYQRGEIIYADFGKGVGHEFSYKHFCIVINKKDNKNNGKVTVIPLTSKSKHNAFVNIHLIKPFLNTLKQSIAKHEKKIESIENIINQNPNDLKVIVYARFLCDSLKNEMKQYDFVENKLKNLVDKSSYAKTQDITTISKDRILNYIKDLSVLIRLPKHKLTDWLTSVSKKWVEQF